MLHYARVVGTLCVLLALTRAAPMPQSDQGSRPRDTRTQTTYIVNGINERIRMFREYCPQLFKVLDNVIQNVTSTAFRVIGRVVLQSGALGIGGGGGGGGGNASSGGGGGGGRVMVVLPTFGPDEDEDYEEDVVGNAQSNAIVRPDTTASTSEASTTTVITTEVDIRIHDAPDDTNELSLDPQAPLFTSPVSASRIKRETPEEAIVRLIRAAEDRKDQDQESAASGGSNSISPSDDLSNVEVDDADRDKRLVPFGGSFDANASGAGGSAGGSGNFLFDIIRSAADGAARTAGTVYRMIAGTDDHVGLGFTATASSSRTFLPQFVAGSGHTEETDERDNAPGGVAEIDIAKGVDAAGEGIPGPITRLFVLANRGIANLIQDIILRIASTSERIVNFKARLITSLI